MSLTEHGSDWQAAEAKYRDFLDRLRANPGGQNGRRISTQVLDVFDAYPHDYDLSNNPLTEPGRRLAGAKRRRRVVILESI